MVVLYAVCTVHESTTTHRGCMHMTCLMWQKCARTCASLRVHNLKVYMSWTSADPKGNTIINHFILPAATPGQSGMCSVAQSWLFVTPCLVAHQASLSMDFSKQEYWSGLPFPSSRWSARPRDQTHVSSVSCNGGWILYRCTIWEAAATPHYSDKDFLDVEIMTRFTLSRL